MNETFKRRLIGLILVIALLFGLSWLLPRDGKGGSGDVPATVVPLPISENASPLPSGDQVATTDSGASTTSIGAGNESPTTTQAGGGEVASPTAEVKPSAPVAVKPSAPKPPAPVARKPDKPAASPASTTTTPPVPAKPASAVPTPPSPTDARTWYVQIGSFADQRNAQTTLSLLNGIGYRGESVAIGGANGTTLYRVRLGPFPDEAAARQAQDKVAHQGYPQSRALSEPAHAP